MGKKTKLFLWVVLLLAVAAVVQGVALIRHGFSARDQPSARDLLGADRPAPGRPFWGEEREEPVHSVTRIDGRGESTFCRPLCRLPRQ